MSGQTSGVPLSEAVDVCMTLMDEAKVPREMVEGRSAGLIERVSYLVAEVERIREGARVARIRLEARQNLTPARSASESRRTP